MGLFLLLVFLESLLGTPIFFQIFTVVSCDLLWFHRNKVAHGGIIPDILVLEASIKKTTLDHFNTLKLSLSLSRWSPPLVRSFKINFDTTIRETFLSQAAVCRDSNGIILKALS
jgi:hypothetical protein